MGSPDFALPTLDALNEAFTVVGVVTQPDRPAGRGRVLQACPVKQRAQALDLPVFQPENLRGEAVAGQLQAWEPDVIIVAAFGQLLPQNILDLPEKGCVNVHASLLPRWRGASPIQAAILAGDTTTGVTIMQMEAGLDTGPILAQREVPLRQGTTAGELSDQLAHLGARTLVEILPSYMRSMLAPLPQDNAQATYTKKLSKADGLLDFADEAETLTRKLYAFDPWPGTYFMLDGKRVKVLDAHIHDSFASEPGMHFVVNGVPAVGTATGLLVLDKVQPEGKSPMEGTAFLNGQPDWLG